jgi:cation transport ATPase
MKPVFAWLIITVLIVIASVADYHFANGSYLRLLSGWSYLGWLALFLISLFLLRNWYRAFAAILIIAVFQDVGLRLLVTKGHGFWPYPISNATSQIYGWWATFLNGRWFGFPNGYFMASGLAIVLLVIARLLEKRRANEYFKQITGCR